MDMKNKDEEFARRYVFSTWQSLMKKDRKGKLFYRPYLAEYDAVIVDEAHGAKAKELKSILQRELA